MFRSRAKEGMGNIGVSELEYQAHHQAKRRNYKLNILRINMSFSCSDDH